MAFDFGAQRKQAEAEGLLGKGDYLKLQEGANRIRLMSECIAHPGTYLGKPNFKWLCYVIDRRDNHLKAFFMGHTIYKQLEALQSNEDYAFQDVPMPYDITINATGAGTKEAKYTVLPAKKETPVTALEQQALADAKPITELEQVLREKRKAAATAAEADTARAMANGSGAALLAAQERAALMAEAVEHEHEGHAGDLDDADIPFGWLLPFIVPALSALSLLA